MALPQQEKPSSVLSPSAAQQATGWRPVTKASDPSDTPAFLVELIASCCGGLPSFRPSFDAVLLALTGPIKRGVEVDAMQCRSPRSSKHHRHAHSDDDDSQAADAQADEEAGALKQPLMQQAGHVTNILAAPNATAPNATAPTSTAAATTTAAVPLLPPPVVAPAGPPAVAPAVLLPALPLG